MRPIILFVFLLQFTSILAQESISHQLIFGNWVGYATVRASRDRETGCGISMKFKLSLSTDYKYHIEILDQGTEGIKEKLCLTATKGAWKEFLQHYKIEEDGFELIDADTLKLNFKSADLGKLAHIRREASEIQILQVTQSQLVLKIGLFTSRLGNETIYLKRQP